MTKDGNTEMTIDEILDNPRTHLGYEKRVVLNDLVEFDFAVIVGLGDKLEVRANLLLGIALESINGVDYEFSIKRALIELEEQGIKINVSEKFTTSTEGSTSETTNSFVSRHKGQASLNSFAITGETEKLNAVSVQRPDLEVIPLPANKWSIASTGGNLIKGIVLDDEVLCKARSDSVQSYNNRSLTAKVTCQSSWFEVETSEKKRANHTKLVGALFAKRLRETNLAYPKMTGKFSIAEVTCSDELTEQYD